MFSRRHEQIIVFLMLVAANAALGWYLHRQWKNYQSRVGWIYSGVAQAEPAVPSASRTRNVEAQNFAEIVNRNLFRPDRSNESAAENVKMPELPYLYGNMNLGDGSFSLMSPGDQPPGPMKRVVPGDVIGGYKLVSIAGSQVIVEWGEKKVSIDVSESARRVPHIREITAPGRSAPTGGQGGATPTAQVTTVAPTGGNSKSTGFAGFGAPPGATPDLPVGTVMGGKIKVELQTMFGRSIQWRDVVPAKP
jgi:hypothetical protein